MNAGGLGIALIAVCAAAMRAQTVQGDFIVAPTTHERISRPLAGAGLLFRPRQGQRLSMRLGIDAAGSLSPDVRSTCQLYFSLDGKCGPRRFRDRSRLILASAGVGVRVMTVNRGRIDTHADLGIGRSSIATQFENNPWGAPRSRMVASGAVGLTVAVDVSRGWSLRLGAGRTAVSPIAGTPYTVAGNVGAARKFDMTFTRISIGAGWPHPSI